MKKFSPLLLAAALLCVCVAPTHAQHRRHNEPDPQPDLKNRPWIKPGLSPDERAATVLQQLTPDEKIGLLHGNGMPGLGEAAAQRVPGQWRRGVHAGRGAPRHSDDSDERRGLRRAQCGEWALLHRAAIEPGIGGEPGSAGSLRLRRANWPRTPRAGLQHDAGRRGQSNAGAAQRRTFEYMGEDPVLAGTLVGNRIKCEQAQHVIGDIKHYAINDQESGRNEVDSIITERVMRESDLLAFEIGIKVGDPAAVMCSYSAVNGNYACENKYLLTDVLKKEWNFKGFVLSDWGGTHSTVKASAAGLDNEEPLDDFYGPKLKEAVQSGQVPMAQIDDHARRVLRSEFAAGLVDYPTQKSVVDVQGGLETAQRIEEQSIVLLKNEQHVLPLDPAKLRSIAILGVNADTGMISGGGSAQVDAPGRPAAKWQEHVWFPTSPLKAIAVKAPGVSVRYGGSDPASAAEAAKGADVAIVFAYPVGERRHGPCRISRCRTSRTS